LFKIVRSIRYRDVVLFVPPSFLRPSLHEVNLARCVWMKEMIITITLANENISWYLWYLLMWYLLINGLKNI